MRGPIPQPGRQKTNDPAECHQSNTGSPCECIVQVQENGQHESDLHCMQTYPQLRPGTSTHPIEAVLQLVTRVTV